ncbi:MAG: hypothetical protein H0T46_08930, partial [Deltaproteobacteria bacterium]|nr:hypothetical protein [Deltaproteobacteria bacterium]
MNKILIASLVVCAAACGEDEAAKGTVNTTSAKASVEQVGKVDSSMSMSNGASAASAVQSMTQAGQSMVTPMGQAGRQLGLLPETFPRPDLSQAVTGTAECTPTSCTFTNYGDDGAGWKINGTITKSGDTTTFDVKYDVVSAGTSLKWDIDGKLTITATSIDGDVHSHGVTDVQGGSGAGAINITWDTLVDYQAIQLDSAGCAVGGSVHAVVSY